jgi:hypothetical protein
MTSIVANFHVERYNELRDEKAQMDERYYSLNKEHETANLELELLWENNRLLKEIVANTKEPLLRTASKVK